MSTYLLKNDSQRIILSTRILAKNTTLYLVQLILDVISPTVVNVMKRQQILIDEFYFLFPNGA